MNIENALLVHLLVDEQNHVPIQDDDLEIPAIFSHGNDARKHTLEDNGERNTPRTPPCQHLTTAPSTPLALFPVSRFLYDEEYNICLNQFQEGDRVTWSMQYGKMVAPCVATGGSNSMMMIFGSVSAKMVICDEVSSSQFNIDCSAPPSMNDVCQHVFHEACILRWSLVCDGCPTCH